MPVTELPHVNYPRNITSQNFAVATKALPSISAGGGRASLVAIPLYSCSVRAGFPSPAEDYVASWLDLNEHLVRHPSATFFVTASGNSMTGAGIQSGDLLIVDRSLEPLHGKIVIAVLGGELTIRRLSCQAGQTQLIPANDTLAAIDIHDETDLIIWGVVTHVIHVPE